MSIPRQNVTAVSIRLPADAAAALCRGEQPGMHTRYTSELPCRTTVETHVLTDAAGCTCLMARRLLAQLLQQDLPGFMLVNRTWAA